MVEEIYNDLKKTYDSIKLVLAAKELSIELEKGEEYTCTYDIPVLTVLYKDLSEETPTDRRLLQVRIRDDNEGRGEEIVMVFTSTGASKVVTDIDTDLHQAAEYVEKFTEDFLLEFPDVVYTYKWADFTLTE